MELTNFMDQNPVKHRRPAKEWMFSLLNASPNNNITYNLHKNKLHSSLLREDQLTSLGLLLRMVILDDLEKFSWNQKLSLDFKDPEELCIAILRRST